MISLQNLEKSFGARTLFEGVSLLLTAGKRYGLVGANGSGKSTLLRMLAGDEQPSSGTIGMPKGVRLGVLRQDRFLDGSATILELAMQGDQDVYALVTEQAKLVAEGRGGEAAELEERLRMLDGYTLEARAGSVLEGLGIETKHHRMALGTLSGGYQLRVLLAQVLLGRPDVLLLDEPTNHLDIISIRWLERFLSAYEGCAIVISHDQRFLDNVVTDVLDVDFETVTLYPGNYSHFEREKAERIAQKAAQIERAEEQIADKRAFVERFGAKATKAKQAQSRLKQIEKLADSMEELRPTSRRAPHLAFVPSRPSGRDVLSAEGVDKSYGDKPVLRGVKLSIRRGERVAIIGANGLGKSTLVRILAGRLEADHGKIAWGHEAHVGYFPQDHKELFPDPERRVLDYLWDFCRLEPTTWVRGQLGAALFSGDDVHKRVDALSGGEAARLLFARIAVEKPNVLLLDEPTNHLDVESIQALAKAVQAFDGTTIFVSHNRWFVSELATRIVEIKPDGVVDFPGGYEDHLAREGDDHLDAEAVLRKKRADDGGPKLERSASAVEREEQKRRRNRLKQAKKQCDDVTAEMDATEAKLAAIRAGWGEEGFYERTSKERVAELQALESKLAAEVDRLLESWESLELEIAELESTGAGD